MNKKTTFATKTFLLSLSLLACNKTDKQQGQEQSKEKPEENKMPNIVFILADDLGYNELSCYGQEHFSTPHIDQLAAEGMRFTDFYAGNTVSGPSRCNLITGKHPGNATVRGNLGIVEKDGPIKLDRVGITNEDKTIGEILKKKGYKTALCGKWHLEHWDDSLSTWPKHRGFDYVIRERWNTKLKESRQEYREETGVIFDYNYPYELWENGNKVTFDGNIEGEQRHLMDDIVTDKGIQFIEENKDNPFFVFFSLKIPHNPETFAEDSGMFKSKGWPECERIHAVRIVHMDKLVKKITEKIDDLGLAENTLILFSSDNGGHSEGGYLEPEVDPCKHDYTFFGSNDPLRGYKRDLYDGGIRVPTIARWKGKIAPGSVSNHIAAFWDLMPTFADMADIHVEYKHDGISFLPEMLGQEQKKHEYMYWEFLNTGKIKDEKTFGFYQAIRKGKWKAVRYGIDNPTELYNLDEDIGEQNDMSDQHPDIVAEMEKLFVSARSKNPMFPYGGGAAVNATEKEIKVLSY
jgi:arylsulfatase A-like enzyme